MHLWLASTNARFCRPAGESSAQRANVVADFIHADLPGSRFERVNLSGAELRAGAILIGPRCARQTQPASARHGISSSGSGTGP